MTADLAATLRAYLADQRAHRMATAHPAEWSKPPHTVYAGSIPEPVCPGCGHDEHDGACPVHRRKLDPCTCEQETSR